jgi:small subunit ribosomal protein S6
MRDYELVYILDPDQTEDEISAAMARVQTIAENQGSEIQSQERWEKRRLAYEINRKREGVYVVMEFKATPTAIDEVDRLLKINDSILRHLIVRAEDVKSPADVARENAAMIDSEDISESDSDSDEAESTADEEYAEDSYGDDESGEDDSSEEA